VKDFGGDAIAANLLPESFEEAGMASGAGWFSTGGVTGGVVTGIAPLLSLLPGQIGGYIVDPSGAVVAGAHVTVTHLDTSVVRDVTTDSSGRWIVSNVPSGRVKIAASSPGFKNLVSNLTYDSNNPTTYSFAMQLAAAMETVEVQASNSALMMESRQIERELKQKDASNASAASSNVFNLQQRVSGVLPVRVDVPRAGTSYSFVRPLVLNEETKVTFTYKTK
jgi:hypothetical protein